MAGNHPLKAFRIEREMTQQALGKELGVSGQTVWRWENGDRQVSRKLISKITKVTGIPARELRPDLAKVFEGA